jgi:carboxylesterase type B
MMQFLSIGWLPYVDGAFIPDQPQTLIAAGTIAPVPFVVGDAEDEGTLFSLAASNITFVTLIHRSALSLPIYSTCPVRMKNLDRTSTFSPCLRSTRAVSTRCLRCTRITRRRARLLTRTRRTQ